MTDLKINLEDYKQIVQKDYTPEQAKPILAIVDKTIQEIDEAYEQTILFNRLCSTYIFNFSWIWMDGGKQLDV